MPVLRRLALGLAAAVLVRLVLNPEVLSYALSDTPIFNWLLYGYGIPAAAFIVATRQFGSRADDLLVKVLEAGSVVFSVLLVSLELWHAFGDRSLRFVLDDFDLNAVETVAWLAMAGWLLHLGERRDRAVLRWSGIDHVRGRDRFRGRLAGDRSQPVDALFGRAGRKAGSSCDSLFLAYALPALLYAVIGICRLGPRAALARRRRFSPPASPFFG